MTEYFDILNEFKGSGEPQGGVWFVGLEEAHKWDLSKENHIKMIKEYKEKNVCVDKNTIKNNAEKYGRKFTKIFDIMSKIIVGIMQTEEDWKVYWKVYRNETLLQKGSSVFQANLYPLGKNKLKEWPLNYKVWFGFEKAEKNKYVEYVRKTRFPMLKKYWEECTPQLTVCFGEVGWSDFECLFGLKKVEYKNHESFKLFLEKKIILTPFFYPPLMPDKKIEHLIDLIKKRITETV